VRRFTEALFVGFDLTIPCDSRFAIDPCSLEARAIRVGPHPRPRLAAPDGALTVEGARLRPLFYYAKGSPVIGSDSKVLASLLEVQSARDSFTYKRQDRAHAVPIGSSKAERIIRRCLDGELHEFGVWGCFKEAERRGVARVPPFSAFFDGPLYVLPLENHAVVILMDLYSIAIERLLALARFRRVARILGLD
jgi:hypothetical protein